MHEGFGRRDGQPWSGTVVTAAGLLWVSAGCETGPLARGMRDTTDGAGDQGVAPEAGEARGDSGVDDATKGGEGPREGVDAAGDVVGGDPSAGNDAAPGIAEAGGDAADAAASPDGGTPGCAGLVCEDFESGSVDPNKWTTVVSGGTLTVQKQQVAHGHYALQAHGQAGPNDDWALLVPKKVPAALPGTTTFGRAYFSAASDATASIHIQFAFAGRNGTGTATGPAPFTQLRYTEVASNGGRWQQGFDLLDVSPLVEEVSYSTNRLPTGAWSCLEWEFEDQPDRVTVWIDGAQVATFDNTNVGFASPGPVPKSGSPLYNGASSGIIGGFETFGFGFHDWHPQRTFDVFYDDLVLDAKRIGCLP